jgi:hypothetical protein
MGAPARSPACIRAFGTLKRQGAHSFRLGIAVNGRYGKKFFNYLGVIGSYKQKICPNFEFGITDQGTVGYEIDGSGDNSLPAFGSGEYRGGLPGYDEHGPAPAADYRLFRGGFRPL